MHRRRQHGSSGELDVFGATSYFAGRATTFPFAIAGKLGHHEDLVIQVKTMMPDDEEKTEESRHARLAAGVLKTNKSKFAAVLGALVSPGSASFRKKPSPSATSTETSQTDDDDRPKVPSSSTSSRSSGDVAVTAASSSVHGSEDDPGVEMCTEDRRLQGVRVVRTSGGDEERWVVRCSADSYWEEHHEKMFGATSSCGHDQMEGQEEGGGDGHGWESDSSSDLFELDLHGT